MKQQPKVRQRQDKSHNLYRSGSSSVFVCYQIVVRAAVYSKGVLLLFLCKDSSFWFSPKTNPCLGELILGDDVEKKTSMCQKVRNQSESRQELSMHRSVIGGFLSLEASFPLKKKHFLLPQPPYLTSLPGAVL